MDLENRAAMRQGLPRVAVYPEVWAARDPDSEVALAALGRLVRVVLLGMDVAAETLMRDKPDCPTNFMAIFSPDLGPDALRGVGDAAVIASNDILSQVQSPYQL
jgi:hypothetical protein